MAFGAALYGWGFTLNMAKQKAIKFSDIIKACQQGKGEKLQKKLPVYEAIFEMAINRAPNPREAQAYRVEAIWDGQVNSPIGKALVNAATMDPRFSA